MNIRTVMIILLAAVCPGIMAQRRWIVADAETGVPVRDVQVFFNGDKTRRSVSDYRGTVILPDSARFIQMSHPKYETLMADTATVRDTVFLLPNIRRLNALVVVGHRPQISSSMMAGITEAAVAAATPSGGVRFDLLELLNLKQRKKQRKRMEAIKDY
ncbi:MAG: hypothetical protein K2G86_09530 [Prevotella sp.]|nr:hypothetical protein [Prevotella sp.]